MNTTNTALHWTFAYLSGESKDVPKSLLKNIDQAIAQEFYCSMQSDSNISVVDRTLRD